MSKKLDDLAPVFKPVACELLARFVEAGYSIAIIGTWRSYEEHLKNVAAGRSWTPRSKHCDGLAIDVCPYEIYRLVGEDKLQWDGNNPIWQRLGEIGEKIPNIKWGGRFRDSKGKLIGDWGHFEYAGGAK
jgi:hypothetical protein